MKARAVSGLLAGGLEYARRVLRAQTVAEGKPQSFAICEAIWKAS